MGKLTDRQVELIEDLLSTYECYCKVSKYVIEEETCGFQFNGETYKIAETDYKKVCEIIDYIKGVKKEC